MLSQRQKAVFGTLIEEYTHSAKAVSSTRLMRKLSLGVSSATIRNVMSELEDMGLLLREHKSAGRMPTDFGYAYYVDSLMEEKEVPGIHKREIIDCLNESISGGIGEILKRTCVAVSRISMLFSVVLTPNIMSGTVLKIDLIRIASSKILIVLTLHGGFIKSILINVDHEIREDELGELNTLLNLRLSGYKLSEVKTNISNLLQGTSAKKRHIVSRLFDAADSLFLEDNMDILHIGETQHVMVQPEFADTERMRVLFEVIEDPVKVSKVLEEADHKSSGGVRIGIGSELDIDNMEGCSVVAARYSIGDIEGRLGILGPTRMPYSRLAALLNFTAFAIQKRMVE